MCCVLAFITDAALFTENNNNNNKKKNEEFRPSQTREKVITHLVVRNK